MELSMVSGNTLWLNLIALGGGLVFVGMFFAGLDSDPIQFVMRSDSYILRWLGVAMLLGAFFMFLGFPMGAVLSTWLGTFFAFFGAGWLVISNFFSNPGDFKPFAWFFAGMGLVMACYAAMVPSALKAFPLLAVGFLILFVLIAIGGFLGFWGLRIKLGWWRPSGISLMLAGLVSWVIAILGLFATAGMISL